MQFKKPQLPPHLNLPFKVEHKLPFEPLKPVNWRQLEEEKKLEEELRERQQQWLDGIKSLARDNLKDDFEYLRISWHNKYKRPKHENFSEYTLEELLLEAWEQHYIANPDNLELKGIHKKINQRTGYKYYSTGDPVIDQLEKEFSEGKVPDLQAALGHIKDGENIFKSPVFQSKPGQIVIPQQKAPEVVKKNEKGEKIGKAGAKIQHDDYKGDDWLKEALEKDPVLEKMASKMKGITDADL